MISNKRHVLSNLANSLRPLFSFGWRMLLTLTVCRTVFVIWQWPRVVAADMLASVYIQGLRFDLVLLGLMLTVPILVFPVLASSRFLVPAWRGLLRVCLPGVLLVIVFMECSTPSFVDQFDSRPNILFFEYLNHPREVAATLWAAYKVPIVAAVFVVTFITWINSRHIARLVKAIEPVGVLPALLVTPILLLLCAGMIRSTLGHRPVNPSTVALSSDPLVNDLALSSAYTTMYALYEMRHEVDGGFRYGEIDDQSAIAVVRDAMRIPAEDFAPGMLPTLHRQRPAAEETQPKNLVIIVEESLGAEFVGSLGGLDLTPNLDELSGQGIWFRDLYATGTRSVRGLEAIVSGFTPTPARSVVKLSKSQRNFFTLAQLLDKAGYESSFIYGGESHFDNMRRFFVNNGFDKVIDKNDYRSPVFAGSWGVCDEDLFDRAHAEFSARRGKPFFSVVFTTSNHSPFEFPDDRIELFDAEKHTVNNAVKYADYALGRFIRTAKNSDYWDDTVFLIVADHNSRVYGSEVVPIDRFHIPGLILGGSIKPAVFDPVASQIDLAPTLLSLIGIAAEHPMIGHDLTRTDALHSPGRAIMQFNATQAYMEGDRVAILQKDLPVQYYAYQQGQLVASDERRDDLGTKALAHASWSSMAYAGALHRLP
ncbi:MAG: LTA synthase family protein [Gammaproteobacteria bacterium]|nr:LTA synthase family protein [Gammaproteobacteria bacterium]